MQPIAAVVLAVLPLLPDVIPSGQKTVRVEARLELGPLAHRARLQHVVAAGDTLSRIALQQLGGAARWQEILAMNPSVDPARMRPGQRLELPARGPLAAGEEPVRIHYEFARVRRRPAPRSLTTAAILDGSSGSQLLVHVVPAAQEAAFEHAVEAGRVELEQLAADGHIVTLVTECRSARVPDDDPTALRRDVYRIVATDGGRLSVELASCESFDAEGKPVVRSADRSGGDRDGDDRRDALLFLLSGGGIVGLIWLASRRAIAARAAAVQVTP